jgi:hypothetical protein
MKTKAIALCLCTALALGAGCSTTYDFDPVTVGEDDSGRDPRPKSSSQFIRSVYADLYGRTPEVYDFTITQGAQILVQFPIDEQEQLVAAQDAVGDPTSLRSRLVAGMVRAAEAGLPTKASVSDPAEFIADKFRRLLGREPSPYELAIFVGEWNADPAVGPHAIVRALIGSREYQSQ